MMDHEDFCHNGWILVTQVFQNVYRQSRVPDAEKGRLEVERQELVRETVLTGLNHDEAWAHDQEHEMVYEMAKACPTCKPAWKPPDQRPQQRDEDEEHRRRVRRVEEGERDDDWGPSRPYKD